MAQHVYDWAKSRGYWLRTGDHEAVPTHLLLDGGKLRVPEEASGALLNAYAVSVARWPERLPCMVELRTPVFKMFLDLDTRFLSRDGACRARFGNDMALAFRTMCGVVCGAVGGGGSVSASGLVCAPEEPKEESDGTFKLGFHVVWPEVLVTAPIARRLRRDIVAALETTCPCETHGLAGTWSTIVDASVFVSNGLRMAWSGKGRAGGSVYRLCGTLTSDGTYDLAEATTLTAMRDTVRRLSIRTFGTTPTVEETQEDELEAEKESSKPRVCSTSMLQYADILPDLAKALPIQFMGQQFTGLLATEHAFMLRSTARYCFNLGRAHRTNNVYFMLTKRGVCQRCYCRCETTEGRKYGMCKDFSSQYWEVPQNVMDAFFPPDDDVADDQPSSPKTQRPATSVGVMPSRSAKSFLSFDNLVARSRPPAATPPRARKRAKKAPPTKA